MTTARFIGCCNSFKLLLSLTDFKNILPLKDPLQKHQYYWLPTGGPSAGQADLHCPECSCCREETGNQKLQVCNWWAEEQGKMLTAFNWRWRPQSLTLKHLLQMIKKRVAVYSGTEFPVYKCLCTMLKQTTSFWPGKVTISQPMLYAPFW